MHPWRVFLFLLFWSVASYECVSCKFDRFKRLTINFVGVWYLGRACCIDHLKSQDIYLIKNNNKKNTNTSAVSSTVSGWYSALKPAWYVAGSIDIFLNSYPLQTTLFLQTANASPKTCNAIETWTPLKHATPFERTTPWYKWATPLKNVQRLLNVQRISLPLTSCRAKE